MSSGGCHICLLEQFPADQLIAKSLCDHYFCPECIGSWMQISKTCPTCRYKLDPILDVRLLETCTGCGTRVYQYDMAKHLKGDCPKGSHTCSVCRQPVPNSERDQHAASHFDAMDASADDTTWLEEEQSEKVVEKLG